MGGKDMRSTLEVCVDSTLSAVAAQEGGADRIELCSDLIIGGITPGHILAKQIKDRISIPIRALIRPRFGDFCYNEDEFSIMLEEIHHFRKLGVSGVVTGILKPDGNMDMERMKKLKEAAGDMDFAIHRAFDMSKDPFKAMEDAVTLGAVTILTSGQEASAWMGRELLKQLVEESNGRIEIMAGGGIDGKQIRELAAYTGLTAFHMSGKVNMDSRMVFRRNGINMGLPGFDEYHIWQTEADKIRCAADQIKNV